MGLWDLREQGARRIEAIGTKYCRKRNWGPQKIGFDPGHATALRCE